MPDRPDDVPKIEKSKLPKKVRKRVNSRHSRHNSVNFSSQRGRIKKKDAKTTVHNQSELLEAIKQTNNIIWIPEDVTINVSRSGPHMIAPGVTIASNRNLGKGRGGLIKTDKYSTRLFMAPKGARVTGIRLKGPQTDYFNPPNENALDMYTACGVHFQGDKGIVDNCEIYAWTGFGVGMGTKSTPTQGWIHHNTMHHFPMDGLGYPIELFNGISLIEWNDFSRYRHVVSGYGWDSNGYEFRCNVVGPPMQQMIVRFACDMHRLGEQDNIKNSNNSGGKYLNIHHNVFEILSDSAVAAQGKPTKYVRIVNNWTAATEDGKTNREIFYVESPKTAKIHDNHFEAAKAGRDWLKRMAPKIPPSNGKPSLSKWDPQKAKKKKKNKGRTETASGGE